MDTRQDAPLWRPSAERAAATNLQQFCTAAGKIAGREIGHDDSDSDRAAGSKLQVCSAAPAGAEIATPSLPSPSPPQAPIANCAPLSRQPLIGLPNMSVWGRWYS